MPPGAFVLVGTFALISLALGIVAWRLAQVPPLHGPRLPHGAAIPVAAAFGAFYLIGHRLGLAIGPEVQLFGFDVALLGDTLIGAVAAAVAAVGQALLLRAAGRRSA